MKRKIAFFVTLFMVTALSASAATFKVGDVYEYKGEVLNDDMYVVGGAVDISGDVNGDGLIAGGDISILGKVTEDVMAVGGSLKLLGPVGDDLRAVGGNITISNTIGGDLVAAGGFIKILSDSVVSGDSVIASGAVIMNGKITGDLTVYGDDVIINGPVGGDVTLKFTKKVTIGENASIAGNLTYSSLEDVVIPEGVIIGGDITQVESPIKNMDLDKKDFAKFLGLIIFAKFLVMLVTGVLAVLVFKKFSNTMGVQTFENFWKHTLIGLITLIVVPIAAILLLVTFFGVSIGFLLLGSYILLIFIAKIYAGIVVGALLSKWIMKDVVVDWKWTILGITALYIVSLIPLLGGFVSFVFLVASFGTLGVLVYKKFWLTR